MTIGDRPATTAHAVRLISIELSIDEAVVKEIIGKYHSTIKSCLASEVPFSMRGIGKFYHRYRKSAVKLDNPNAQHYVGKISKEIRFKVSTDTRNELNGWVHDLKIKNNLPKELLRLAIKPNEIEKIRRRKILEDQQSLGFRADLLFDEGEIPEADQNTLKNLDEAPTVEQILERIGINIGER